MFLFFAHFHLIFKLPNTEKAVQEGGKCQMSCLPLNTCSIRVNECKCGGPARSAHMRKQNSQAEEKLAKCATARSEKHQIFSVSRTAG